MKNTKLYPSDSVSFSGPVDNFVLNVSEMLLTTCTWENSGYITGFFGARR